MKKLLSIFIVVAIIFSVTSVFNMPVSASESEYAWVLVNTYEFPIPEALSEEGYFGDLIGNSIELKFAWPYGLGWYGSKDYNNPTNLHAKYTWDSPPNVIKPNEVVNITLNQEVISNRTGNYNIGFSPFFDMDSADMSLDTATSSKISSTKTYADGTKASKFGVGYGSDDQSQNSFTANMTLKFRDKGSLGDKQGLYIGVYSGAPGSLGTRYTYEWKKVGAGNNGESQPTGNLGTYSWQGEWDTNWGKMVLVQNGPNITGTYTYDNGKITGKVSGNTMIGTWAEAPSYAPPSDAGDIEFTMSSDGKSFSGKWRYGSEGNWGNWEGGKRITEVILAPTTTTTPSTTTGNSGAESFESGARIMWQPVKGLGYRLFRSTSPNTLGISVTDFYITSTSYADVNVESNTTYYYSVKPVLAEAKPFEGIEEKLGNIIATFTVKTGNQTYKPGSYKHFIMLRLEDPNMSVDGINQEIDPGKGTKPLIITGRTMIPIRAVVEAMDGSVEWDGNTQKITLKARGNTVEMWIGKTDIKINGVSKKMDVAPVIKNGRTFVPVRFAAENLNCKVDWINSTKEAIIVYEE